MLSESFVAASSAPPKLGSSHSAQLKDAGVFVHSFKPQAGLQTTFKKSIASPRCLAVSDSHIFTAQSDKAVLNVYNREKGNHEAAIPFAERLKCIVLTANDAVLALGTESGSIILWELCTGRQVATPPAHLEAVDVLAADISSNFLLSGSSDATVLVWPLPQLLAFPASAGAVSRDERRPRHTLSAHRGAITSIVTGRSYSPTNIAATASQDKSICIWNYSSGELLRTFLLPSAPLCVALDPAERALYAGFEDGSVQLVNFFQDGKGVDASHASTPIQPSPSNRWAASPADAGATLSMSTTFETTTIFTGHASGKIIAWDIASGDNSTFADHAGAPITNLLFLRPLGFPNEATKPFKILSVVKPRPHEDYSSAKGPGRLTNTYNFAAQLSNRLSNQSSSWFNEALAHSYFPDNLLSEGIAELTQWNTSKDSEAAAGEADFMPLDPVAVEGETSEKHKGEIAAYKERIEYLKKLQHFSYKRIDELVQENEVLHASQEDRGSKRRKTVPDSKVATNGETANNQNGH